MTVSTTESQIDYTGNGATVFAIPFLFLANGDLVLTKMDANDLVTTLVLGSDYTLSGAKNPSGGTATLTAPLTTGNRLRIARVMTPVQETDLRNQGKFYQQTIEDAFDYVTLLVQQYKSAIANAMQKSIGGLFWDALGLPIRNVGTPTKANDATTKNYVDTSIANSSAASNAYTDAKFAKTVRTPENIGSLPGAAARAGMLMGFDASGNPVPVAPAGGPISDASQSLWSRQALSSAIANVHQALDAQPVTLWEFAGLITSKPNPGDPATWDWTPALLAAAATWPVIDGRGETYRITNTTLTQRVSLSNINFKPFSSVTGFTLLTIAGDDSVIDVVVDADGKGITCVDVSGNRVRGHVSGKNIIGQLQASGGTQSVLRILGSDCEMTVHGENLSLGTSTNTSIPRVLTTDLAIAGATRNTVSATGYNVQCGWVTAQDYVNVPVLSLDGVNDNGIYHLGGVATAGNVRVAHGIDEPVVAQVGSLHIGNLVLVDCDAFCSISNANLSIDDYRIVSTVAGKAVQPLVLRPTNANSKVSIGRLSGRTELVKDPTVGGIFQMAAGSCDLSVEELDLEVHYATGSTKILSVMTNVASYNFGKIAIQLVDDTGTLTSADKFDFRLPVSPTAPSYIGDVFNRSTTGEIRLANAIQDFLQTLPGQEVSTTFGPYILQETNTNQCPRIFIGPGAPTVGTWLRGDTIIVKFPSIGSVAMYRCTTGGSPGTWRACGHVSGRGITASRPTLTANDNGVLYLDNTLNANGKPIWWNGTAWVDSEGAVV